MYILYKRVNQDKKINERQESDKAADKGAHPLDPLKDVKDEVVTEYGEVHIVEVGLNIVEGISGVVDGEGYIN